MRGCETIWNPTTNRKIGKWFDFIAIRNKRKDSTKSKFESKIELIPIQRGDPHLPYLLLLTDFPVFEGLGDITL